jgi:very-short-patch-repair endonuclease
MTKIYNKRSEAPKRKLLRRSMSKPEVILWIHLSRKQMLGYKFRRQCSVDKYVIDFYSPRLKLAVEVDGQSHVEKGAPEYDQSRQSYIEALGIRFLRFTNDEIYKELQGLLQRIATTIQALKKTDTGTVKDFGQTSPK